MYTYNCTRVVVHVGPAIFENIFLTETGPYWRCVTQAEDLSVIFSKYDGHVSRIASLVSSPTSQSATTQVKDSFVSFARSISSFGIVRVAPTKERKCGIHFRVTRYHAHGTVYEWRILFKWLIEDAHISHPRDIYTTFVESQKSEENADCVRQLICALFSRVLIRTVSFQSRESKYRELEILIETLIGHE